LDILEQKVRTLVSDKDAIYRLLTFEKDRRGLSSKELVFVGTATVAMYHWCPTKSYMLSRINELKYFTIYLQDRILYSYRLGYINEIPGKLEEKVLDIGNNITLKDVEKILKEKSVKLEEQLKSNITSWTGEEGYKVTVIERSLAIIHYGNIKLAYINPTLKYSVRKKFELKAEELNALIVDFDSFPPKIRGIVLEAMIKEKYPTVRWNFEWNKYVIVAEPDGLTEDIVYEFKTTKNMRTYGEIFKAAEAQADIYGYFFRRKRKKIQTYILSENKLLTINENINKGHAEETLASFLKIDKCREFLKPEKWKCKICELRNKCPAV